MATLYSFLLLSAFLFTFIDVRSARWVDAKQHDNWMDKLHHRSYQERRRTLAKVASPLLTDVESQEARSLRNSKLITLMKDSLAKTKNGKLGKKYKPKTRPLPNCGNTTNTTPDTYTTPGTYTTPDTYTFPWYTTPGPNDPCANTTYVEPTNITCGESTLSSSSMGHHIVGGQAAERGMFPWQVGLSSSSGGFIWCGGSYVIGNDGRPKVITASHCVSDEATYGWDLYATFGLLDVNDRAGSVTWKVSKIIMHPGYNSSTMQNDVAILEFEEPLNEMPEKAKPVCIASTPHKGGEVAYVSGWGDTTEGGSGSDQLQYVQKILLTLDDCRQATLYEDHDIQVTEDMICAGKKGIDSCQGDSGGPLVTENADGKWELIGVVSWGEGCGLEGYPGVYANVPYLYDWINNKL